MHDCCELWFIRFALRFWKKLWTHNSDWRGVAVRVDCGVDAKGWFVNEFDLAIWATTWINFMHVDQRVQFTEAMAKSLQMYSVAFAHGRS